MLKKILIMIMFLVIAITPLNAQETDREIKAKITKIYRELLKRNPDSGGLIEYTKSIKSGFLNWDSLREGMKNSEEYRNLHNLPKVTSKPKKKKKVSKFKKFRNRIKKNFKRIKNKIRGKKGKKDKNGNMDDVLTGGDTPDGRNVNGKGRLIRWVCTGEQAGKVVHQYEDGSIKDGMWYGHTVKAWEGASLMFRDRTGVDISKEKPYAYETKVMSYLPHTGKYVDNGQTAKIPDKVHWKILISGGYVIEFDYSNSRDCIYSGNGIYWLQGNGHSITIPANHTRMYKGKRTNIR